MTEQTPVNETTAVKATPTLPDAQTVTEIEHYTDRLFRFRCTRPASLRFRSGEFVMIGLMGDPDPKTGKQKPLLRAYSIASPSWDDELEFYSIKVPDGPLTSKLQNIQVGDEVIVRPKPVGTLVLDALLPGKRLYMLATGTGIAPFASLVRDPEVYEAYDKVILTHGVRYVSELAYQKDIEELPENEFFGEMVQGKLEYYPTVTREEFRNQGRLTDAMETGKITEDLGMPKLDVENDRFMICGSPAMLKDSCKLLDSLGFRETRNGHLGHYVIERAFVEH